MAEDNKLTSALISASASIAKEEGVTDDEQVAVRAQAIYEDAIKDEPATDAGKQAKARADDIVAVQDTGIASPYASVPKFDYDKHRDETALAAVGDIFKKLGEHSAFLAIPTKASDEYQKESEKSYDRLALETFRILNTNKVGMAQFKYVFDSLKAVISALDEYVMQQVVQNRHEIMSRTFGARNPGNGKYDSNHATYAELTATLERVRNETGGNLDDYFSRTKEGNE